MATYEIIRETHGEATCLATTLGGQRWWITRTAEFSFTVETCLEVQYGDIEVVAVKTCRSLAAAQKWLEQHWRDWVPDERCESYTREGTMCYIQLSLLGCAGYVKIGNTLTDPMHDGDDPTAYWYTPGYFSSVWQLRRIFRSMDRLFEEAG